MGHHLSTIEGGYVFTDNDQLAAMCKVVRAHGWTRNLEETEFSLLDIHRVSSFEQPYTFEYPGFNVRPSEINAFAGTLQLPILNKMNEIRKKHYEIFLNTIPNYIYSEFSEKINPVFAIPIKCNSLSQKQRLTQYLKANQIECRPLISGSIGRQPFWKRLYGEIALPNATQVDNLGLYITNDPQLSPNEFDYMLSKVKEYFCDNAN